MVPSLLVTQSLVANPALGGGTDGVRQCGDGRSVLGQLGDVSVQRLSSPQRVQADRELQILLCNRKPELRAVQYFPVSWMTAQ